MSPKPAPLRRPPASPRAGRDQPWAVARPPARRSCGWVRTRHPQTHVGDTHGRWTRSRLAAMEIAPGVRSGVRRVRSERLGAGGMVLAAAAPAAHGLRVVGRDAGQLGAPRAHGGGHPGGLGHPVRVSDDGVRGSSYRSRGTGVLRGDGRSGPTGDVSDVRRRQPRADVSLPKFLRTAVKQGVRAG